MFNYFFKQPEECFICCSIDGKTDAEKNFEMAYNQKTINYPLIKLSDAYGCKCHNLYAHNKCLFGIIKCPTCRKCIKPNLYVKTNYDYYIPFFLNYIKQDNSRIEKIKIYACVYVIFMCAILFLFDKHKESVNKIIPPNSNISFIFAMIIGIGYFFSLWFFFVFEDYLKKYWLYIKKTKKCYVFL